MNGIRLGLIGLGLAVLCGVGVAEESVAPAMSFRIDAQPVDSALKAFANQSGLQLLFHVEGAGISQGMQSPGVEGVLTPEVALARLLVNTGLRYEFINARTVTIRGSGAEKREPTADVGWRGKARVAQGEDSGASGASVSGQGLQGEQASSDTEDNPQDTKLEEIVVTAQKRVERLQDVPAPITVVNTLALTETNNVRLQDFAAKVPGVSLGLGGNGGEPLVVIRGMLTGAETNPTTGYVVDEVAYGASVTTGPNVVTPPDIDPGDLARIEVLRGAQGVLYGASGIGGLLKFVTVEPQTDRVSGRLQVGANTVADSGDVGHNVRGALNLPLAETAAVRISGFALRNPGFIDNVETDDRDVNAFESSGARTSLLWNPSNDFSLKLGALVQNSERKGIPDIDARLGLKNYRQSTLVGTGGYSRKSQVYTATATERVGDVEIVSATGYSIDHAENNVDATSNFGFYANRYFPEATRAKNAVSRHVKKFSEELRAIVPISEALSWRIGGFFTTEDTDLHADNFATNDDGQVAGLILDNVYLVSKYREYALFSSAELKLSERFDVEAGLRSSRNKNKFQLSLSGPLIAEFYEGVNPKIDPLFDGNDTAQTYLATARYRITNDRMVYARFATGYRPGGGRTRAAVTSRFHASSQLIQRIPTIWASKVLCSAVSSVLILPCTTSIGAIFRFR